MIAPVTAVAGNMDDGKLGKLPREVTGKVGGVRFLVGHKRKRLLKRLAIGKIEGVGKHDVAGPRRLRSRPPAGRRVGRRHAVPQPGVGECAALRGRRPTIAIVESGPVGLGVRFVRIPRRADDES